MTVRIAFVGDGYSDACATHAADLVFAKKDLEHYCRINNIDFIKYDGFSDVARYLIEREGVIDEEPSQKNGADQ